MAALRVGLTGGIASGKSTVGRLLAAAGFRVIDADELVADLYRPGAEGAQAVRELFGEQFLDAEGGVDHAALAARVFADQDARAQLEAAIHPLVRLRFAELAEATDGVVVLEATLLAESGFASAFDLVVSVEASSEIRLARAVARGADPDDTRARMAVQGTGASRRAAAHWLVLNNGSPEALAAVVDALAREIRRRAGQGP